VPHDAVQTEPDRPVGAVAILSFVCELAMLALLAYAGWRIGDSTATRLISAIVSPAVAVAVWARWMAPASPARLRDPARLVAQVAVFAAVGAALVVADRPWSGVGFAALASAVFALTRRFD
jgi:uncharacterized protein DUF2568